MTMKKLTYMMIAGTLFFFSCQKDSIDEQPNPSSPTSMSDLVVPSNFDFKTTQDIQLNVTTKDFAGTAMNGIRIDVLTDYEANGGKIISSGATINGGKLQIPVRIPDALNAVVLKTTFIGYPSEVKVPVQGNQVSYNYGGAISKAKASANYTAGSALYSKYRLMGSYDVNGLPSYLTTSDVFDAQFLQNVNASLPEQYPVPTYHPEYLSSSNETDIRLIENCEVWITFVHEGAGWQNLLGYYTYDINNPPTSPSQIDSIKVIFPNVSMTNSGGSLTPGNKIKLGIFSKNTGIGWVLAANGWNNGNLTQGSHMVYSEPSFNPEPQASLKQHTVLLKDAGRGLYLIGFEDMRRDQGSDNDFNDAIFYVKSNPITAIDGQNIPPAVNTLPDTDGDGISDITDDYPSDPTKAFNNYYPSKENYASLAYEDLWPDTGDYDFNDMVVDYFMNPITNATNQVVEIESKFIVRASGALYKNGFGFEMPIAPSAVQSVTGSKITENYINLSANGTESQQSKSVVIVFDNAEKTFKSFAGGNPSGMVGINTVKGGKTGVPDTINIKIKLTSPVNASTLGLPPYNPFLISNSTRGREIHLPNMTPTSLANLTLFGTGKDNSIPASGRYYKTANNLPWAINITEKFDYPTEKTDILKAYLMFAHWAETGGTANKEWYKNNPGYRESQNIY